jgi:hypothetical protein
VRAHRFGYCDLRANPSEPHVVADLAHPIGVLHVPELEVRVGLAQYCNFASSWAAPGDGVAKPFRQFIRRSDQA